jgi:myo-inositol-1(or 4)-monophosphatase
MFELKDDLTIAIDAARGAGAAIMEAFRSGIAVQYKEEDQPVTEADLAADRFIKETLLAARPNYGWLSEETLDDPARLDEDPVWIVDPIDGTNSFVEGRPEFAVSIGLAREGIPVVGVVYNPATDELYHATKGGGAFLNGEPIRVRAKPEGEDLPCLVCSRSERLIGELSALEERWALTPLGSTAYKIVKVAEGVFQGYVSARIRHEWDLCAAVLILEEAGGEALTLEAQPIRFNRPEPYVSGIAALPLHAEAARAELLAHLRSLFSGERT